MALAVVEGNSAGVPWTGLVPEDLRLRPWIALPMMVLMIACGVDRGPAHGKAAVREQSMTMEPARETFALGTAVTASGAVAQQSIGDNFIRGGEVYLSVDVSGASSDQTVEVRWVGPDGRVLRSDARLAVRGAHYLPFSSGQTKGWTRGDHRAVIRINGRTVSEKAFAVL